MRKIRLFSIAALALAMAACSSEENTLETQSPAANGKLHFTATIATPDNGAGTRTEYSEQADGTINVAWKQDDEIAIVNDVNPGTNYKMTVGTVNTTDGSATISGDITNPTITAELGTMGTTVISFFAGPAPEACQLGGSYTGVNSVKVGDTYGPYTADITCKITPNPDGTLNVEIPEHLLNETAIGNLTLGKVTIKNLYYDEANKRFYKEYGKLDKDLTMHFKAEGTGVQVINRYQLGKMPFLIVATFQGAIASEK